VTGDQPTSTPTIVDTLTATWQALSDLGVDLTDEQWKSPTDLPGWSVQDTLSHVIGTERLLEGLPAADPLPGEPPTHVRNTIGELNEREVAARRGRRGTDVLAEWDELRTIREATLASASDDYFQQSVDTPTGPGKMIDFLAMRILDCWVHEQDMRRALDLPSTCDNAAAAHSLYRLTSALPMVVGKRAACPEGAAVELQLTGPLERRLVCEVNNRRAAFVDAPATPAQASISMDTECYLVLATGRRSADDVADCVTITGDTDLAARVVAGLNVLF
jgi:uncharacterized protein (TIGR03083 family)